MNDKLEQLRIEFANNFSMSKKDFDELAKEIEATTTPVERSIMRKLLDFISPPQTSDN